MLEGLEKLGTKVAEAGVSIKDWARVRRLTQEAQRAEKEYERRRRKRDQGLQNTPLMNNEGEFLLIGRGLSSPLQGEATEKTMMLLKSGPIGALDFPLTEETTTGDLDQLKVKLNKLSCNLSEREPSQNFFDPERTLIQQAWYFSKPGSELVDAVALDYNRASGIPSKILIRESVLSPEGVAKSAIYSKSTA